ncbi:hypothetical protein PTR02_24110 [Serratia nevei]|uniref:hypothetical protein n=1 Tax=Serratia TaxID=613 RepID=UPI001CDD0BB6|nr:hypothetical protein [Serratia marcescens]MCA4113811.1 hypothetical protein [Serratia marcescens]
MMGDVSFYLLFMAIPFVCLTVMFVVLVAANRKTTGEIKYILPPDVLLKIFAVFLLTCVVFILSVSKLLSESAIAALLGAIASGTLGISFSSKEK